MRPAVALEDRLWPRVTKTSTCWLWRGSCFTNGYGQITDAAVSLGGSGKARAVHIVVYELLIGPVPEGLVLDHLCRVRHCCRPTHLEPVTNFVNTVTRSRHPHAVAHLTDTCLQGHSLTGSNVIRKKNGRRRCRTCFNEYKRAWRAERELQLA